MTNSNLPEKVQNFVIFQTETGKVNIEVFFYNETLWLTQKKIAELFEKDRSVITKHLKNIFNEGELDEKVVCADFAHTTQQGKISALEAKIKAEAEYDIFRVIQDKQYISDFDEEVRKLIGKDKDGKNEAHPEFAYLWTTLCY